MDETSVPRAGFEVATKAWTGSETALGSQLSGNKVKYSFRTLFRRVHENKRAIVLLWYKRLRHGHPQLQAEDIRRPPTSVWTPLLPTSQLSPLRPESEPIAEEGEPSSWCVHDWRGSLVPVWPVTSAWLYVPLSVYLDTCLGQVDAWSKGAISSYRDVSFGYITMSGVSRIKGEYTLLFGQRYICDEWWEELVGYLSVSKTVVVMKTHLHNMRHMAIARKRFGKHIPEVTLSTTVHQLLGNRCVFYAVVRPEIM